MSAGPLVNTARSTKSLQSQVYRITVVSFSYTRYNRSPILLNVFQSSKVQRVICTALWESNVGKVLFQATVVLFSLSSQGRLGAESTRITKSTAAGIGFVPMNELHSQSASLEITIL